jgi:hypothetical protein
MRHSVRIATLIVLSAVLVQPVAGAAGEKAVNLQIFAPKSGDVAGVQSRAFLIDLVARFNVDLASTLASPELTGPGAHANTAPLPGHSVPGANTDHFPGLVVMLSSTRIGAGAGQNLADLFNIVAVTNQRDSDKTDIWSTWIIGAKNAFGLESVLTPTRLFVAVVDGTAPNVVTDVNGDGTFDEDDLEAMGFHVISNVKKIDFTINGF